MKSGDTTSSKFEKYPFVTIVMPVRNEAAFISRSLNSVLAQDYPMDRLEIIVADGMSSDRTQAIIRDIQLNQSNLQLINNPGKIAPTGLNVAIKQAKGEIIIRVDGHCEIAPDYVSRCIEKLAESNADVVGGPIETIGDTPMAKSIALAMSSWFGIGGSTYRTTNDKEMWVETVVFPAYPRSTIEKVGLFDEELVRNQDDEYNYRLLKSNGKILLSPTIRSRYYSRSSLRKLWKQYFQYGFWKVRVFQKHPRQMRLRQFVPPLFVFTLVSLILIGIISPLGWTLLVFFVFTYGIANGISSIRIAYSNSWHHLPFLPLIFACLHLSYGLGFWVGLIKFAGRWKDRFNLSPE